MVILFHKRENINDIIDSENIVFGYDYLMIRHLEYVLLVVKLCYKY